MLHFLLRQIPLVRLVVPFLVGIVSGIYLPVDVFRYPLPVFLLVVVIIIAICIAHYRVSSYSARWLSGTVIMAGMVIIGFLYVNVRNVVHCPCYFSRLIKDNEYVIIKIAERLKKDTYAHKAAAEVVAVAKGTRLSPACGRLIVYIPAKDTCRWSYGDWLVITAASIQSTTPPKNPHEFDYRQFLSYRQIYHRAHLKRDEWRRVKHVAGGDLIARLMRWNEWLVEQLRQHVMHPQSHAIASSLLLGNRDYLDRELIRVYSSAGAMHVLAVSGLHVGILYLVIDKILFFADRRNRIGYFLKMLIVIGVIWCYALLTGLSPSVQRASIMFSLIAAGQQLNRSYNIYNVLAGAAWIQVLFNPFVIMEVGFQLSYLAVLGIVMFQKLFYDKAFFRHKLADYFWQITAVSLAAQFTTFPIGLLYFHQFPVCFFLSNLIVIPAALLIMLVGILFFITTPALTLAAVVGKVLNIIILATNRVLFAIEKLPFALIDGVNISTAETWIIYLLILLFFIIINHYNRSKLVILFLFTLFILIAINVAENYRQYRQRMFVVYHTPRGTYAYDFILGKENLLFTSPALSENRDRMQFHIMPHWWVRGIRQNHVFPFYSSFQLMRSGEIAQAGNYVFFHGKRVLIINNTFLIRKGESKCRVDYIVLQNNPQITLEQIRSVYDVKTIIADCSNSAEKINRWEQEAAQTGVLFYNVARSGAFLVNI